MRALRSVVSVTFSTWCVVPADLKSMTERLKNRYYHHKRLFCADMKRIFTNCRAYNGADTEYCKCATALEKFFQQKMKDANLWD